MLGNHTQHSDTHLPIVSNRKSVFRGSEPNGVGTQRIIAILSDLGYAPGI